MDRREMGKSVISQAIRDVLPGDMAIPHAISIDGHIIRIYDPVNHQRVETLMDDPGLERRDVPDGRWVRCRRPLITAGGELTMDALELGYSPSSRLYNAPLQVLANGGVLVIDDFGGNRRRRKCYSAGGSSLSRVASTS